MITPQPRHPVDIAREQIAGQIEQYLAAGGQIQSVPSGVSGEKAFSIWTRGVMVVSDESKPKPRPVVSPRSRPPGSSDMSAAQEGKLRAAAKERALLARTVRYCAEQRMTISATTESMAITRNTVRRIATEHSIQFKGRTMKDVANEFCAA